MNKTRTGIILFIFLEGNQFLKLKFISRWFHRYAEFKNSKNASVQIKSTAKILMVFNMARQKFKKKRETS